jgi:hypothetical protein
VVDLARLARLETRPRLQAVALRDEVLVARGDGEQRRDRARSAAIRRSDRIRKLTPARIAS